MPALAEEEVVAAEAEAEALAEVVAVAESRAAVAEAAVELAARRALAGPAHRRRVRPAESLVLRAASRDLQEASTVHPRCRHGPQGEAAHGQARFPADRNSAAVPASGLVPAWEPAPVSEIAPAWEPAPVSQLVLVNCPQAAPAVPESQRAQGLAEGQELEDRVASDNGPASQRFPHSVPVRPSAPE
jgi:hypothetical protein